MGSDLFTCRADVDPDTVLRPVHEVLGCVDVRAQRLDRVMPPASAGVGGPSGW